MKPKYSHLLSPIKVGNTVLRNRIVSSSASPHYICGAESSAGDGYLTHYANLAKNGAAVVIVDDWSEDQINSPARDVQRYPHYDIHNPRVTNGASLLAESIHFYGSKVLVAVTADFPDGIGVYDNPNPRPIPGHKPIPQRPATLEDMERAIAEMLDLVRYYKECGFDGVSFHMSYRSHMGAQFLTPAMNKRTDEFGGPIENRARYPLMQFKAIKDTFGQDFLVECHISGEDPEGGITVEDTVKFAKLAEGLVDILMIRAADIELAHPTGYNSEEGNPVTLRVAQAIKDSGAKLIVCPSGGYQDLDLDDRYLAENKCDMIAMARSFIADPDYYRKAVEGRGEDVIPCLRCDKCHVAFMGGPWINVCSVNPLYGIEHRYERLIESVSPRKIAVIGGGPIGMRAALYAKEQGHDVTIYEKTGKLGGQLFHADYPGFKWPLKNYKDYLIRQVEKAGIPVLLNTEATPELIGQGGYDAVFAATGAAPKLPDIPGVDGANVHTHLSVYGSEEKLGHKVVVIGGSESAVETALYLAECGHGVTVLSRRERLASDATLIHFYFSFMDRWKRNENFHELTEVKTLAITAEGVTYRDKDGVEHTAACDDVVACGGMAPLEAEALAFYGCAPVFKFIGDCTAPGGNLQRGNRQAYSAVNTL